MTQEYNNIDLEKRPEGLNSNQNAMNEITPFNTSNSYPNTNPNPAINNNRKNRFGLALTSFILGCVSFFLFLLMVIAVFTETESGEMIVTGLILFLNFPILLISFIFGLIAIRSSKGRGFAIAGVATSGTLLLIITLLMVIGMTVD